MSPPGLSEEEPLPSIVTSDNDAEFENDDELDRTLQAEHADNDAASSQLLNGVNGHIIEEDGEEYEEETMEGQNNGSEVALSDLDGEGNENDEPGDDDGASAEEDDEQEAEEQGDESGEEDTEGVGAVKIQPGFDQEDDEDDVSAQEDGESDDDAQAESEGSNSEDDSEVEAEWEAEAAEEDEDAETAVSAGGANNCIFCEQDEDHDPSVEFEEYLACAVCGDNAHRQCARDNDALKSDDEAEQWRCPGCVSNALEPEAAPVDATASPSARRSSVPKLARDLLPSQRGAIKPDSHSVFNHLIVDDDPLDGSRLLRKRKTSSAEAEDRPIFPKRRRRNVSEVLKEDADVAQGGSETGLVAGSANDEKAKALPHRPSRSLRLKSSGNLRVYTVQKSLHKLILGMRIDPIELRHILSQPAKPKKSRNRNRSEPVPRRRRRSSAVAAAYMPQSYTQPFYSFHDRENDELKSKPYGGILTGDEANTEKTLPQAEDRRRFDDTRQKAEDDWKLKTAAAAADNEVVRKPRKVSGPASQIECINFGGYEIDTWYAAPYPEEYSRNRVLHVCEFCLKYMSSEYVAWRHKLKCQAKHPPGDEIYRDGQIAVFEVDGRKNPVYCQNLCLLAKLFLGSKTLYYDVEPFLFYVMTVYDKFGCHFVGYFSKEKRPSSQNNVSCILTLPIHQRKGYGNLLIDFSYLLTRVEQKSGSPEKPLSDMGLVSYRNYWRLILCYQLRNQREPLSIVDISERTGMTADDIVSALEGLRALVRDPETGTYALRLDHDFFEEYIQKWEDKKYVKLNEKALVWTPYIMGRSNTAIMEHAPALNALAPRDDEEEDSKKDTALQLALSNGSSEMINGITPTNEARDPSSMEIDKRPLDITDPTPTLSESHLVDQVLKTEPSADEADVSPSNGLHQSTLSETPKTNGHPTSIHDIPPTRFEIYPPLPGTRNHKSLISRSATRQRTGAPSTSRPSARRRTSGRPGATRRRSTGTSSRRRTGGTGRGPGRWPKGTTKKDFGNAGSGPGLPPRLLKARSRLGQELSREGDEGDQEEEEGGEDGNGEGSEEEEEVDEDAILYETPGPSRSRRSMGSRARSYGGKGAQFGTPAGGEEDEYEPVVGDVDAEAEEE